MGSEMCIRDRTFAVDENTSNGTVVGNVLGSDVDAGANGDLTFSATGGTGFGAFAIDSNGQITVADVSQLDFGTSSSITLDV